MSWEKLECLDEAKTDLLDVIDWPHAFIREISIVSPSYIISATRDTVAPDCLPCAKVFVSVDCEDVPGVELLFVDVDEFSNLFTVDLKPNVTIIGAKTKWLFGDKAHPIVCKGIYYRFLDIDSWGPKLQYAWEDPFDSVREVVI